MKPRFFCFVYELEAGLLPGMIEGVRRVYPDAPVHLIDDARRPLPREAVEALPGERVFYERSTFFRNGNLNGPECIYGMTEVFLRHLRAGEQLVKIDADCLLLHADNVRALLNQGYGYIAPRVAAYHFGGYFYAMPAPVLALARDLLPRPERILAGAHEDIVIGTTAYSAAAMLNLPSKILPSSAQLGPDCWQGAFSHEPQGEARADYIDALLANGTLMVTLGNPGVSREQSLQAQQALLEALRRRDRGETGKEAAAASKDDAAAGSPRARRSAARAAREAEEGGEKAGRKRRVKGI